MEPVISIQVVLIWTQAVKLHKNFVHFKQSLRMNKKNILIKYSLFFKPIKGHETIYTLTEYTCIETTINL